MFKNSKYVYVPEPEKIKGEVKTWFNSNKQRNILLILVIILGVILLFTTKSCNSLKTDLAVSNQNNKALSDSVRFSKNKVGELEASRNVLISEKRGLEKLSKDLAEEVKKEKGKVYSLNKYILTIGNKPGDTVYIENTLIEYKNGEYGLDWKYDTIFDTENSRNLTGISKFKLVDGNIIPLNTLITKDDVNFSLVTGLKEKDDNIEIFVRSNYPGFNVINLEGAIIDPKKNPVFKKFITPKKWSVGPYIGFGFSSSLTPSVQIGVGLQYSIFKF